MGLFNKSTTLIPDFSQFVTDLHSHLLPGLDDGSANLDESVRMLRGLSDAGFKKVITTPHVNTALYANTKEQIIGQLYHIREVIIHENIPVEIEASAEYHMDYEFLGRVQSGEVIPIGKKNYLLIELPFQSPSFSYNEILFQVQLLGYEIIISHPERYVWLMGNKKLYEGLKDRGVLFQMNLNSLTGLYGFPARMAAHQLIDAGMIEFIGSDAHYPGHITEMMKALNTRHFARLAESGKLLNNQL